MLITMRCVAEVPSRAQAASRPVLAPSLPVPAAPSRVRGQADLAAGAGFMRGGWSGGTKAAAGYLPGIAGSFRIGQLAAIPAQAGPAQMRTTKKTVHNTTDQQNSIQETRLVPVSRGEVGPHPAREPGPA